MRTVRLLLAFAAVLVLLAGSTWYGLLHTQPGARWLWSQAERATGGALTARQLSGDLAGGLSVSELAFVAEGATISATAVTLDIELGLSPLTVAVGAARISGLVVKLPDSGAAESDGERQPFELEKLRLPFVLTIAQLRLDDARLLRGEEDTLVAVERATFAAHWANSIEIRNLELQNPVVGAAGDGRLQLQQPYELGIDLEVLAQPELTGLTKPMAARVSATGPLDAFAVEARSDEPRAKLSGTIAGIRQSFHWDLALEVPSATLPPEAELPDVPPISLFAEGSGGTRAFTAHATLGFAGTKSTASVSANVDLEAGTVSGDVDWNNAQWPPAGPDPQLASRRGRLAVSGSLDNWTADGSVQLSVPGLPPGQFTIKGGGDRDHATVRILDGAVLGGTLAGRAEYRWRDAHRWSASLDLRKVKTDALLPDWPATLSGHIDVSGQQQPLAVTARLRDIRGEFRQQRLRASGRVDFREGIVSADGLSVSHGDSTLALDGNPHSAGGLRFSAYVDDLGNYVDQAYGAIESNGALSLRPGQPHLEFRASSEELRFRDTTIVGLRVEDRGHAANVLDVEITAVEARIGGFTATELRLAAVAAQDVQSVEMAFTTAGLATVAGISGRFDDWNDPARWSGRLRRLDLKHADFSATLADPASVELTRRSAAVRGLCLEAANGISLCTDNAWSDTMGIDLSATLSSVPANLVNAFIDTGLEFDQLLSGDLNWRRTRQGKSTGRVDVAMSGGVVAGRARPDRQLETGNAKLRFRIDSNNLHSGVLDLPLPGLGQVAARFGVRDVAGDGAAAIRGDVDIDIADIAFAETLFPVLDDVGGRLVAELVIAGSITDPTVTGQITLADGSISYLPIGLRLTEVTLNSELEGRGEIEISGSFVAGKGRGRIRTRANGRRTAHKGLQIELRGNNLTLIDLPDLRAVADTDVAIGFDGKSLQLNGRVEVPHARIRPRNLDINRISESDDVVIVGGALPEDPTTDGSEADLLINGSVEVALGNDVVVDIDVAETSVTGSTVFSWNGPLIPTANGRYIVKGEILAYGQKLEISEGAVRFPDVPANDPYLRIRAEREIFGNTQVRRAGVLVAGTVSRPTIEAYTTPMTTEERALTLLVTGSEFDYEKGVGAFDFGTYIAPRVYASYGIGLFDQENVIRVRYDLTEGFGITLTSGQRDEGVDLTYRFEN